MQFLYGDSPQIQVIYSNYQKKALRIVFNKSNEQKCKETCKETLPSIYTEWSS